jgi:hypothetical protein
MKNPLDRWQQRHARQRYMPRTHVRRGGATTPRVAAAALVLIVAVLLGLELRDTGGEHAALAEWVAGQARPPVEVVAAAARGHRLVFLTDIPGAAAPKELAAAALEAAARDRGLDVLAVQADPALQARIDRYLLSDPEDPGLLLAHPGLSREASAASRAWVDLLRRVHAVNGELGPTRAIRVVALDQEGWPPGPGTGPHDLVRAFTRRDSAMLRTLDQEVFARDAQARVLFLLDGLHAMDSRAAVQTGGTARERTHSLPLLMRERYPADVWIGIVDATAGLTGPGPVASYVGTTLPDALRAAELRPPLAVPLNDRFQGFVPGIRVRTTPGMSFEFEPPDTPLSGRGNAWIWLGG